MQQATMSSNKSLSHDGMDEQRQPFMIKEVTIFLVLCVALPYVIGLYLAERNLTTMHQLVAPILFPSLLSATTTTTTTTAAVTAASLRDLDNCYDRLVSQMYFGMQIQQRDRPFDNVTVVLHRNGEVIPCGDTGSIHLEQEFKAVLRGMNECPTDFEDKYQLDSILTRLFHSILGTTCASQEPNRRKTDEGLFGFCDMGESKTPILLDHDKLIPIRSVLHRGNNKTYLPCHFHNEHGIRIISLPTLAQFARVAKQLPAPLSSPSLSGSNCDSTSETDQCVLAGQSENDDDHEATAPPRRELHLYAVPAGRMFMFAPAYVGQIIDLPHVEGGDPTKPVYLQVLSLSPRVFDLYNFFSRDESAALVDRALQETKESHRIKRSSTGAAGYNINDRRTSESGYDTTGPIAMKIKRRCLKVLGFDEYIESHSDGLQILRYNLTTAYVSHYDWIDGGEDLDHNFDSSGQGGNRFATILLYMADMGDKDGGETVFTEAWPVGQAEDNHVSTLEALRQLRESGEGALLKRGSWQEQMVASCRTKLAIKPNSARAVLFYSQYPNGQKDPKSLHGGCPVLNGTKYAANLWVWNTPRQGFAGNPKNPRFQAKHQTDLSPPEQDGVATATTDSLFVKVEATFRNAQKLPEYDGAELFFHHNSGSGGDDDNDESWGLLGPNDPPISVNTYKGHIWHIKVRGQVMKTLEITGEETEVNLSF